MAHSIFGPDKPNPDTFEIHSKNLSKEETRTFPRTHRARASTLPLFLGIFTGIFGSIKSPLTGNRCNTPPPQKNKKIQSIAEKRFQSQNNPRIHQPSNENHK